MISHPRYEFTIEELFVRVYVLIDDWLKTNKKKFNLPSQPNQVASYSELFTIAIVGEMLSQPYESVWYWMSKEQHKDLFPRLPEYSRYHRILRNAEKIFAELACYLAEHKVQLGCKIIDTLIDLNGLFQRWSIVPAHIHETQVSPGLTEHLEDELVLGDRAYIGVPEVVKSKRHNMKQSDSRWKPLFTRLRKRIETSFSVLTRSLHLHVGQVKNLRSLLTRVNLKIAAHNLFLSRILSTLS